jgi:hypothetical protein
MPYPPSLGVRNVKRVVLGIYLLSVAYCVVWIPWSVTTSGRYGTDHQRLGYGWVWAGPQYPRSPGQNSAGRYGFADVDGFIAEDATRSQWDATSQYAVPDTMLIAFRIIAATAVAGAAFILAGISRPLTST